MVGQHVADINPVSIIVHCGNQSNFVAADVKHGEFPNLVSVRKGLAQLHKIRKTAFPHNRIPMREGRFGVGVFASELIQALPRNDVHYEIERLIGTFPDEKGESDVRRFPPINLWGLTAPVICGLTKEQEQEKEIRGQAGMPDGRVSLEG